MNTTAVLSIFVPVFLTLSAGIGAVFLFRGHYYKSLAQRVDELEERDHKNYQELQRVRAENETLRRLVSGEVALEQLVEIERMHEGKASERHLAILNSLELLRSAINARP